MQSLAYCTYLLYMHPSSLIVLVYISKSKTFSCDSKNFTGVLICAFWAFIFVANKSSRLTNLLQKITKKLTISKRVKDFIIRTEKGVRSKWSALQGRLSAVDSKQGCANASLELDCKSVLFGPHPGPRFIWFPAFLCNPLCLTALVVSGAVTSSCCHGSHLQKVMSGWIGRALFFFC